MEPVATFFEQHDDDITEQKDTFTFDVIGAERAPLRLFNTAHLLIALPHTDEKSRLGCYVVRATCDYDLIDQLPWLPARLQCQVTLLHIDDEVDIQIHAIAPNPDGPEFIHLLTTVDPRQRSQPAPATPCRVNTATP